MTIIESNQDQATLASAQIEAGRRAFIKTLSASAVGAAVFAAAEGSFTEAYAQSVSDADILNFALNLEYLEATYYLIALTGQGLQAGDIGSAPGTVVGGSQVPFAVPVVQAYAVEIAIQERTHVQYLRSALGGAAVSRPNLDIVNSFNGLGQLAFQQNFNPYANDTNFLLGSYVFEDVGVTAYHGALALLQNRAYIVAASGILAAESYHAAIIRTSLFAQQNQQIANLTGAIANIRSALANNGNATADDHGIGTVGSPHITDLDNNAIAYVRNTTQVLNIVYGGTGRVGRGGAFFPNGMNGTIR